MRKAQPAFLASRREPTGCTWQIFGLPFDGTSSYRRGARFGPGEIRKASDSIETYSPYCQRDLEALNVFDAGDLEFESDSPEEAIDIISEYYRNQAHSGQRILGIGGEHSVTIGAVKGLVQGGMRPCVLYLDAHFDLREEYLRGRHSHACVARRLVEILGTEQLILWGQRSGEREEWDWASKRGIYAGRELSNLRDACRKLQGKLVYISLDLDILDPAEMPGVGNPEPGGLTFKDFIVTFKEFIPLNIIGADIVELSPVWDPGGRSAITAAEIVREFLLTVG